MGAAPTFGPVSYGVDGLNDVPIVAGATLGPIPFRFPRAVFVTSLVLHERNGDAAHLSKLALRIQDETFQDIITDGRSKNTMRGLGALVCLSGPFAGNLVALRPFMIQRPVLDGDKWLFSVTNTSGGTVQCELHIHFDEAFRG